MKNLEQILELWEIDAEMDQTEPGKELINIPKLHNKYLSILVKHKLASKKAHFDYTRMRTIKWEYYKGKFTQEDYELHGWEPFDLKLKSDVGTYLEADNDLIKLLQRKMVHDETISVVESIMGEIKQRSWQLRSFIDWERFISGN